MRIAVFIAAISISSSFGAAAAPATATFAGGCFWCVEADFEKLPGVEKAVSGYTGGISENPTYEAVTYGDTGHLEAVEVHYDDEVVNYRDLTAYFLRHIDPTDAGGQFCDRGASYRTAIFTSDPGEREIALDEIEKAASIIGAEIVTPVRDLGAFWPAEEYHQDYYKKNKLKYGYYRRACGRDKRVSEVWRNG